MSAPDALPGFESITPPDSAWCNAVAARDRPEDRALPARPARGEHRLPAARLHLRRRLAGERQSGRQGRARRPAGRGRALPDRPLRDLQRRVVRARGVAPGGVPGAPPQRTFTVRLNVVAADRHGQREPAAGALGELDDDAPASLCRGRRSACPCARRRWPGRSSSRSRRRCRCGPRRARASGGGGGRRARDDRRRGSAAAARPGPVGGTPSGSLPPARRRVDEAGAARAQRRRVDAGGRRVGERVAARQQLGGLNWTPSE